MGFHAVATGYLLKKHGQLTDYLKVFVKEFSTLDEEKKVLKTYNSDEMVEYWKQRCSEELYQPSDVIDDEDYKTVLYDDIVFDGNELRYKENQKIIIGEPHCCACMIYLGCVGDDFGGKLKNLKFEDKDVLDLINWKNELVKQGRLQENVKFTLSYNCCS